MALYASAQQLLLLLPLVLVGGSSASAATQGVALASLAAAIGYHAWLARGAFALRWPAALLRSLGALALTAAGYAVMLSVALGLLFLR